MSEEQNSKQMGQFVLLMAAMGPLNEALRGYEQIAAEAREWTESKQDTAERHAAAERIVRELAATPYRSDELVATSMERVTGAYEQWRGDRG